MKKIGIVSCYFQHNYGSMLQAYATQMALDNLGYDNETIDISGFSSEIKRAKIMYFAKVALTSDILLSKMGMVKNVIRKKISRGDYKRNVLIRNKKFDSFLQNKFRLSQKYLSKTELNEKCKDIYSTILVGSDQLWLPGNIAADYYTLNFVPNKVNTVAYATSFGQSELPDDSAKKAKIFLNKIRHIGIREEAGQTLIKKLVGRNVPVVCDPTLLLTGEEWLTIQENHPIVSDPYILCYFLGNNQPHREFAQKLRSETGLKIITLPHLDEYVKSDEHYADEMLYDIGPADFLNLIRYASYICTDSYHCSVFSMLYKKEFFAFRRYTRKTISSTNSRLDSIFNILGIKDRILEGAENIEKCLEMKIDYAHVHSNLEKFRKESFQYLIDAINDKRSTDL